MDCQVVPTAPGPGFMPLSSAFLFVGTGPVTCFQPSEVTRCNISPTRNLSSWLGLRTKWLLGRPTGQGAEGSLQMTTFRPTAHRELDAANSHVSPDVGSSPVKVKWSCCPRWHLTGRLSDAEADDWMPDRQKVWGKKRVLFRTTRLAVMLLHSNAY